MTTPTHEQVRDALADVGGVARVTVRRADDGRDRLHVQLEPAADPDLVAAAMARTLNERFGLHVDPETIAARLAEVVPRVSRSTEAAGAPEVPPTDEGVEPGRVTRVHPERLGKIARRRQHNGQRERRRAVIQDLLVQPDDLHVRAEAVLVLEGNELTGMATGPATEQSTLRAVARATLEAMEQTVPGRVVFDLDSVQVVGDGQVERAVVSVTFFSRDGEEQLVGVSTVRDDPAHAVMRATLDALNRRVEPYL